MKHYIEFPDYNRLSPFAREKLFNAYRTWLETNIGEQGKEWEYNTGDLCARGLCLKKKLDATAFRLKFKL